MARTQVFTLEVNCQLDGQRPTAQGRRLANHLAGLIRSTVRVRVIDCTPATNIDRRDVIRVSDEATRNTGESCLSRTISFSHTTAGNTGPAGIARINKHHCYTHLLRFIAHKQTQLVERPVMQLVSSLARNVDSITDTR